MTIIIDDAGMGDPLYGIVIDTYRSETQEFRYEILDAKYFRPSTRPALILTVDIFRRRG